MKISTIIGFASAGAGVVFLATLAAAAFLPEPWSGAVAASGLCVVVAMAATHPLWYGKGGQR